MVVLQFCRGRLAVLPLVAAGGGGDVSSRLTSVNQCPVQNVRINTAFMSRICQDVMKRKTRRGARA